MIDVEKFGGVNGFRQSSGDISRSCWPLADPFCFGRCDSRKPEVRLQAAGSTVVDEIIENKG